MPARLHFADETEVDRFVTMLERFERGDVDTAEWRAFRLVHGAYGQRQEGDLSMLRAKLPQGLLDAPKLRALADVADRFSRGFCHVTTRQNVQFHFLQLARVGDAMRVLAEVGITTREACGNAVRNVTLSPTAGIASDEVFDATPYAEALTRYLLRHALSSTLPRKFKIAFNGGGQDHAYAAINDIGWHARVGEVDGALQRGFLVTVAGGTATLCRTGHVLFEFLPAGDMLSVAEALLRVFHRLGDRVNRHKNRMKFLLARMGWDAFRAEVLAELDAVRAEGSPRLAFDPEHPPAVAPPTAPRGPRPTLETLRDLAGATDTRGPGIHPRKLPIAGRGDEATTWRATNVAPQHQHGYVAVTVTLPLGDITAGQLRGLALIAEAYSDGIVRVTTSQNLLLCFVHAREVDDVHASLRAIGLSRSDAASLADVVSCPGAESCKLAVTQSRGLARVVSDHFVDRPDVLARARGLAVNVSGCPNGCGLHHVAAIGFQGGLRKIDGRPVPQYFVYLGGGVDGPTARFGRVVAKIPAQRITVAIERLLALAEEHRTDGESVRHVLERLDPSVAKSRLADLEVLGVDDARPEDFVDLGETETFAPKTTDGECAA